MFWADKIADEVIRKYQDRIDRGEPIVVRDEKTASGKVHVGSLRSASLHAMVHDVLRERGVKTIFKFEINDFDPLDGIPSYLDESEYQKYMGVPLCKIPSPEPGFENFAELYGQEYVKVLNEIGFGAEVYRASELYRKGAMNEVMKKALDRREKIIELDRKISGSKRRDDWYPINVVCEQCGNLSATKVSDWDGSTVSYVCSSDTIKWAQGCGHSGRVSPFNGNAKFGWKVDWAAKFVVNGVHFEGGGKDHYTKGGSRDVSEAICREVFEYDPPYGVFNEFFLVGGKKMSSSKGNAATAMEMAALLPPHILRLLLLKTPINRQIDFDPDGDAIPVLFDTYDRLAEKTWAGEENDETRIFRMSHFPEERNSLVKRYLPRFSQIAFLVQMPHMNIETEVATMKGSELNEYDKAEIDMRSTYARRWLDGYADDAFIFKLQESVPESSHSLTQVQRDALNLLAEKIENSNLFDGQSLHSLIHAVKEESGLDPKTFFSAIYVMFLGKESGPKVGWFLSTLKKEFVIERLRSV